MGAKGAYIVVGKVGAPHGVRGWVKIHTYTESPQNLLDYHPWYLAKTEQSEDWQAVEVLEIQQHGKGLVARFEACDDRDAAAGYRGRFIAITRDQLPEPEQGEYYWVDLEGLKVVNLEGVELGIVDHLMETGANDVLVVQGERLRLIPYVQGPIVKQVDMDDGVIRVDWGADYD